MQDLQLFEEDPESWRQIDPSLFKSFEDPTAAQFRISRTYVQIWNDERGGGRKQIRSKQLVPTTDPENPKYIKATVWRYHEPHDNFYEYVFNQARSEFMKRTEELYSYLKERNALGGLKDEFERALGIGQYVGKGMGVEEFDPKTLEEVGRETQEGKVLRKHIAKNFAATLPKVLLKELIVEIVKHKYKVKHHTTSGAAFTFYPVQDLYPYLKADPRSADQSEVVEQYPEGNTEQDPIAVPKTSGKSFSPVLAIRTREEKIYYFENIPNPDYGLIDFKGGPQQQTKERLADMVISWGLLGEENPPPIAAYPTGEQGGYSFRDILSFDNVDATKFPNSGLFRSEVKKGNLTEEETEDESKTKKRRKLLEISSIDKRIVTAAQSWWFDHKGKSYDSQAELESVYRDLWEEQDKVLIISAVSERLYRELSSIKPEVEIAVPGEVVEDQVEEEKLKEVEQPPKPFWQQTKDWISEKVVEPLTPEPAFAKVERKMIKVANSLDRKGYYQEADKVDSIRKQLKRVKGEHDE